MTNREQIIALVAEGKSNAEIAEVLGLSVAGVRYHREPSKQKVTMRKMVKYLYDRAMAEDQATNK